MNERQPADEQDPQPHGPRAGAGETAGAPASPGAPALEEQIATLAAHVRRLGQRLLSAQPPPSERPPDPTPDPAGDPAGAWAPGERYASATPAAEERAQGGQPVVPAPAAATWSHRWEHLRAPTAAAPASQPQPAAASLATDEDILAMAEAAAGEIRASAEREAQRIREVVANDASERVAELLAIIAGQCESVAGLSAEAQRIEHSAATLREQARALEADLQVMLRALSAVAATDR